MPSTMLKLKMNPRKRKIPLSADMDDTILAMLSQETSYSCIDYLSITPWQSTKQRKGKGTIDEYCREQICEWTYRVVDYFRIDREVVSVSLNYLDRFLCKCTCDRSMFKLAATTTLYMAVKVVHPQKLGDLGILSDLSRGEFDMRNVAEMEQDILATLEWKLHPPTPAALSMLLLDHIKVKMLTVHDLEDLYSNTSFFAELSVCDYFFVTLRPSTVALACILNALEGMMQRSDDLVMRKVYRFHVPTRDLAAARNRLWELYERSEECALHNDLHPPKPNVVAQPKPFNAAVHNCNSTSSPVSVASERCTNAGKQEYCYTTKSLHNNGSW